MASSLHGGFVMQASLASASATVQDTGALSAAALSQVQDPVAPWKSHSVLSAFEVELEILGI